MTDKDRQRQLAYAAREAQADKDRVSAEICRRCIEQPWYQAAATVLWYVHCRSEVRTMPALSAALQEHRRIAVPYCTVDDNGDKCLGLWHLRDIGELRAGLWNIPEPPSHRWSEPDRQIEVAELDAVLVPGVAFDRGGGRLGNGAGYFDRLLCRVRSDAVLAGICYQSQLLPVIEMQSHDIYMDYVITEQRVYCGGRRRT